MSFFNHSEFSSYVAYIDCYFLFVVESVADFEVEPTSMSSSVGVNSEMNIVLTLRYFSYEINITALEVTTELDLVVTYCWFTLCLLDLF